MVSISQESKFIFENIGNGSAQAGYNSFQISNFNLSGLLLTNIFFIVLLLFSERIDKKLNKYNESIKIKGYEFYLIPSIKRICLSALFLINFSTFLTYQIISEGIL